MNSGLEISGDADRQTVCFPSPITVRAPVARTGTDSVPRSAFYMGGTEGNDPSQVASRAHSPLGLTVNFQENSKWEREMCKQVGEPKLSASSGGRTCAVCGAALCAYLASGRWLLPVDFCPAKSLRSTLYEVAQQWRGKGLGKGLPAKSGSMDDSKVQLDQLCLWTLKPDRKSWLTGSAFPKATAARKCV